MKYLFFTGLPILLFFITFLFRYSSFFDKLFYFTYVSSALIVSVSIIALYLPLFGIIIVNEGTSSIIALILSLAILAKGDKFKNWIKYYDYSDFCYAVRELVFTFVDDVSQAEKVYAALEPEVQKILYDQYAKKPHPRHDLPQVAFVTLNCSVARIKRTLQDPLEASYITIAKECLDMLRDNDYIEDYTYDFALELLNWKELPTLYYEQLKRPIKF